MQHLTVRHRRKTLANMHQVITMELKITIRYGLR